MASITKANHYTVIKEDRRRADAGPLLAIRVVEARSGPLLAFGLALLVYLAAALIMRPLPTGDEPHYLLYAYSLVHTGSLDLRSSYSDGAARLFYPESLSPASQAYDYRHDGSLISVHNIGLAMLIAPVVYLTNSALAVRLEMVLISALAAQQLYLLLRQSGVARPRYTWLAFGATALSMPFLVYSNQIYPDVPAALLVLYAIRVLGARQPRTRSLFLAALAAALLPWLHVRYLVLTAGLALGVIARFYQRRSISSLFLALGLVATSALLMAVAFVNWYGSPLPTAPYVAAYQGNARLSLPTPASLYFFGLGELLNAESGWLPFAPVQLIGLIGLAAWARRFRLSAFWALVFLGGYLLVTTGADGVGQSFPARYLIPVVLLIALPLALALQVNRPIRYAFAVLLVLAVAIDGMAVLHYQYLYPRTNTLPTGRTLLPVAASLQNFWPRFQAPSLPTAFQATPAQLPRRVGRLESTARPGQAPSVVAHAVPDRDSAGFLTYGPNDLLQAGQYRANFTLAASGEFADQPVITLDVRVQPGDVVARRELRLADFSSDQDFQTFTLPFTLTEPGVVEARVYYAGQSAVWLRAIEVTAESAVPPAAKSYPDWPVTLLWLLGTVATAVLLLRTEDQLPRSNGRYRGESGTGELGYQTESSGIGSEFSQRP